MLQMDEKVRMPLSTIRVHPWVLMEHPKTAPAVRVPPSSDGDPYRGTTLIPYLENMYKGSVDSFAELRSSMQQLNINKSTELNQSTISVRRRSIVDDKEGLNVKFAHVKKLKSSSTCKQQ
eukprot:Colp12_sorted_trinity150504_noHs@33825